jgi:tRNA A-37 threonylcarbamoyl transferase component Bud32
MFSHFVRKLAPAPGSAKLSRLAGRAWHVLPAGWKLFGPHGPDFDAWLRDGRAVVVKTGGPRTVYRVELDNAVVYVKRTRSTTPRQWAREFLRPAKARLEFENALELLRRGVPAAEPLAWGANSRWLPGESFSITLGRPNAAALDEYLQRHPRRRRNVAAVLGRLFAHLHDAGVAHPDPHPGNILAETAAGRLQFTLLDVHAVRFGSPLNWAASIENLVLLNRWFQLRATRSDRRRFWTNYVAARQTLPTRCPQQLKAMARYLERRTARSNARFWTDRLSRYTSSNRQYQKLGRAGFAVRDLDAALARQLQADPDFPFRDPARTVLKSSRTSDVILLTISTADGPRRAVYKRFNIKGKLWAVKNLLRPTPALRSWVLGHSLRDRGLPTPRPLAVLHRRRVGVPAQGYLLVEYLPDARGLDDAAHDLAPAALGRVLRDLHAKQIAHRDLKAANVLVAHGEPFFVDLVGLTAGREVPRRVRVRDLARLNASFWQRRDVSRTARLRVLFAYLNAGLHGRAGWKDWWRAIAAATAAKAARNVRAGRMLG